jgi:general secretion pathway protein D
MKFKLLSFVFLIVFVASCAPKQTVKQDELLPPAPVSSEVQVPDREDLKDEMKEAKPQVSEPERRTEEQYVMLNFENADIGTVISTISEMLKMNYILAPGVTGKITIQSQSRVPLSELFSTLQTILEFNGFTAIKDGSFYRIVPIDTAKQQPVQVDSGKYPELPKDASFITQQIPLDHVRANDVANIMRNLMPRGTDITVYEPSNMLIVTAPASGLLKAMKLLEAIDIPSTEQDSVRTFVYNVENGEAKKLAEVLKSLYGKQRDSTAPVRATVPGQPATQAALRRPLPVAAAPAAPPVPGAPEGLAGVIEGEVLFDAYEDINALIIRATPRAYISLLETIKRLDTQPKQVLIEVLIAEISLNDRLDMGLEWVLKGKSRINNKNFDYITGNARNPGGFFERSGSVDKDNNPIPNLSKFAPVVTGGVFANLLSADEFNILINAAASSGNVNVLASPHILALDNKEAKIEIASEVPVATTISQPQTTQELFTSQVQFKSAGTILTVTPHINERKQVTLKIAQEVSEVGDSVLIGGQAYTGFNTRKATTTAIVQDGHTLVIGGIISERVTKTRNGIPFLSKIPVLGYLFGATLDQLERRELILMITPHVVANHEEADLLTEEYKMKVQGLKRKIHDREQKFLRERGDVTQADIHLHESPESTDK